MTRPSFVKVGIYRWRISWNAADLERIASSVEVGPADALGACLAREQIIAIDPLPSSALRTEQATLLHELLHACVHSASIDLPLEVEEMVIAGFSTPLLSVIRENPKIIAYLTA